MSIEQVRRLIRVWSWLPAFRVVAEMEHVHQAAELLCITPSALSRSVRLLEDDLGVALFVRTGRGLKLTSHGEALLGAVREAMRRLDDGVGEATQKEWEGPLCVAAPSPLQPGIIVPALRALCRAHPSLVTRVSSSAPDETSERVLRGELDVAFVYDAHKVDGLVVEHTGAISHGVYCAKNHSLAVRAASVSHSARAARPLSLDDTVGHAFVSYGVAVNEPADYWPVERDRSVVLFLSDAHAAATACLGGDLLVALPDVCGEALAPGYALVRLPVHLGEPLVLYAVRRTPLGASSLPEALVSEVRRLVSRELSVTAAMPSAAPTHRR